MKNEEAVWTHTQKITNFKSLLQNVHRSNKQIGRLVNGQKDENYIPLHIFPLPGISFYYVPINDTSFAACFCPSGTERHFLNPHCYPLNEADDVTVTCYKKYQMLPHNYV